jgi:DIS3-like exonuclease 1
MCVNDPTATRDAKERSTIMLKDGTISDICDNLNLKSRESKFAQRVKLKKKGTAKQKLICQL